MRIKLHLCDQNMEDHFIDPMPQIPRKGDMIDVFKVILHQNYSIDEINKIDNLMWIVYSVEWSKDKDGYFVEVACYGE